MNNPTDFHKTVYLDQMDKNNYHDDFPTYREQSSVSEASSKTYYLPKWFKRLIFGNDSISSKCPYCGIQAAETVIVQHLEQCQQVTRTLTRPDGSMTSITYAGPNNDVKAALRQGAVNDKYNMRYHHEQIE